MPKLESVMAYVAADGQLYSTEMEAAQSTAETMRNGARLDLAMIIASMITLETGKVSFLLSKLDDINRAARYFDVTAEDILSGAF